MSTIRDYLNDAKKHEQVFRSILRSLEIKKLNPELNSEAPLEEIFQLYSTGNRYGKWTILDFRVGPFKSSLEEFFKDEALFSSEDIACLSGYGKTTKYKIKKDNSIEPLKNLSVWMS